MPVPGPLSPLAFSPPGGRGPPPLRERHADIQFHFPFRWAVKRLLDKAAVGGGKWETKGVDQCDLDRGNLQYIIAWRSLST